MGADTYSHPSYGGRNYTDCLDKCGKHEESCEDGSCKKVSIREFVCNCLSKCDATGSMDFPACSTQLDTCFEHAPKNGYDHLKCWHKTCDTFYTAIKDSREKGEDTWEGLGGWQVFDGPLPGLSLRGAQTAPAAGLGAIAMLSMAGFLVWRVVSRRLSQTSLIVQEHQLQAFNPGSDDEPIVE